MATHSDTGSESAGPDNVVLLRGRLADAAQYRELPSGDLLAVFRLVVARPPHERVRVDTIDCTSLTPRVHRSLDRAAAGDLLEVTGSLRRRFYRSPAGPASRYAVDVQRVKVSRAGRAGRPGAAARARRQASV